MEDKLPYNFMRVKALLYELFLYILYGVNDLGKAFLLSYFFLKFISLDVVLKFFILVLLTKVVILYPALSPPYYDTIVLR